MNKHLTEQQLIDYQFKLADQAGLNQARTHLGQCEQCRRKLEKLARKFAALDLLRGEVKVPEDLLSRTVEQVVRPRRSRAIWLYRVPALGAVAAAVIAGAALLLVSNDRPKNATVPTVSPGLPPQNDAAAPARSETQVAKSLLPEADGLGEVGRAEPAGQSKSLSFDMEPTAIAPGAAGRVDRAPKREESRLGTRLAPPESRARACPRPDRGTQKSPRQERRKQIRNLNSVGAHTKGRRHRGRRDPKTV
jgi:hypothetical protein